VEPYDSEYADRIAKMAGLDTNDEIAEKVAVKVKAKRGRKPRTSDLATVPEPAPERAAQEACWATAAAKSKADFAASEAGVDPAEYAANEALLNTHPEWINSTTIGD
jgi:hypothetical protein